MAVEPRDVRLLAKGPFRRLLESRALGQVAQNALLYGLLILVVDETGSSLQSSIFVAIYILPSILLGVPIGGLAEGMPLRGLLLTAYVLRAAAAGAMLFYRDSLWRVYLLLMGFATVGQFTGPREASALPRLVGHGQLPAANSFFLLALMLGQIGGAVILAPLLLKTLGIEAVLAVAAALFLATAFVASLIAEPPHTSPAGREPAPALRDAWAQGWRLLRSSRSAFMAAVYLAIAGTLVKTLAVLAPHYTKDVLDISTENAVYVIAPAGIGALAALAVTPPAVKFLGASRVVAGGFLLLILGLAGLGLVVYVRDFILEHWDLGISFVEEEVGVSSVITVAMIIAIPVGFATTLVTVAGKAVLNQEAPEGSQARVFATQSAAADALSLMPLFVIAGISDLVGVRATLLAAAGSGLLLAAYLGLSDRFRPPPEPAEPPAPAG